MLRPAKPVEERFWPNVTFEPNTGCWLWMGAYSAAGYGQIMIGRKALKTNRIVYTHRLSFEMAGGEIPPGMHIDHECLIRQCVNPKHMQVLTPAKHQNVTLERLPESPQTVRSRKRTHCKNGHELSGDNEVFGTGHNAYRQCRTCKNEGLRAWRRKKEMKNVTL